MSNAGPAIASLMVPGLGQACQGRPLAAARDFGFAVAVWVCTCGMLGWIVHLLSAFGAARWKP